MQVKLGMEQHTIGSLFYANFFLTGKGGGLVGQQDAQIKLKFRTEVQTLCSLTHANFPADL